MSDGSQGILVLGALLLGAAQLSLLVAIIATGTLLGLRLAGKVPD